MKIVASVAGKLGIAHNIISQLTVEMDKLVELHNRGEHIYREHIENAIDKARAHEMKRRYNSSSRINFGVTLHQLLTRKLPHGKIDKYAWGEIYRLIFKQPLMAEMIVAGYLVDEPVLIKASGKRDLETDSEPPVFVIGSKGARFAMEHLNKRGQHIFSSFPQTLLHIHEAIEIARRNDDFIGPCPAYIVMLRDQKDFAQIAHNASCLGGWAAVYADRPHTDTLNNDISRKQAEMCMTKIAPSVRFRRKPLPQPASGGNPFHSPLRERQRARGDDMTLVDCPAV
jgi:hypothetical protein